MQCKVLFIEVVFLIYVTDKENKQKTATVEGLYIQLYTLGCLTLHSPFSLGNLTLLLALACTHAQQGVIVLSRSLASVHVRPSVHRFYR